MKQLILLYLAAFLVLSGCKNREKEKALEQRSMELDAKEMQLLLREKTIELQESDLAERIRRADSVAMISDTLPKLDSVVLNPAIVGIWNVTMTCTFTSCPGSAVGDTRTEQWQLSYEGSHVVARARDHGKLVRVYSGLYTGNRFELIEHRDTTGLTYDTRMVVRLNVIDPTTIEGQREIIREDECRIVYALQLKKTN